LSRTNDDAKRTTVNGAAGDWGSASGRTCWPTALLTSWRKWAATVALAGAVAAGGCANTQIHGYMAPEGALEQLPLGSTQEQVLIVLGTPSTVATISGEVFYYISQRSEQTSFLPPKETDRRVIAVYFDKSRRVQRLADYGLKDGKIFDYISRTTPSGGVEQNTLGLMFKIFKS
jgi:outer membrane protein assembly factor BamE (lipoprotein component of BamABCDE complex)